MQPSNKNPWRGVFSQTIIVEIVFGTGGDDSKILCDELLDAYSKYAKNLKLETVLLQNSFGHKILQVSGPNAVKAFENETGGRL